MSSSSEKMRAKYWNMYKSSVRFYFPLSLFENEGNPKSGSLWNLALNEHYFRVFVSSGKMNIGAY